MFYVFCIKLLYCCIVNAFVGHIKDKIAFEEILTLEDKHFRFLEKQSFITGQEIFT